MIAYFRSNQGIGWNFTPENAIYFGRLWEAVVKSFKRHRRHVLGGVCFTFEELTTTLAQVEACLNSRPLTAMPESDKCIEDLTPGHFLLGSLLEAHPDPTNSFHEIPLLKRWHLCQTLKGKSMEVLVCGVPRPNAKPQ